MGCWNGTCGITNLPIMYGERIVTFVCENKRFNHRPCYSTTLAEPIFTHIRGEYNDYGSIENIDPNKNNDLLLKFINNKYKVNCSTLEECITKISNDEIGELFLFMVKEPIFDQLINEIGNRFPYKKFINMRTLIVTNLIKFKKEAIKIKNCKDEILKITKEMKLDNMLYDFSGETRIILRYMKKHNSIDIDKILEYILFNYAMNGLRKSFYPQSGSGSQSQEMYLHKLVGQYIINEEKSVIDKFNEDNSNFYEKDELSKKWHATDNALPTKETYF